MGFINLVKEDHLAILSIVRPEALNALNSDILKELDFVVENIKDDKDIYCLIIHSDKNFAAGADIKAMVDCDEKSAKAFSFTPVYDKIAELPMPVIAAIEGYALGGGFELALCADIRIAGENSKIGFPEVSLGIFPGAGGTIRAPKLVGAAYAMELIFTGDAIGSDRALQMGLLNKVVPDDQVLEEAKKMASRIIRRAPIAVQSAKAVIKKGLEMSNVNEGTALEGDEWAKLFKTEDRREGMVAFLEKRKPVFKNK